MGQDRDFKPYYIAHKKIETLALLDEGKCSICFNWRPHDEANRSESVISANNIITLTNHIPLYIGLAPKATELHMLGMSITGISKALKVSKDTVIHALNHLDRN
ncbi:MAG: hypothetical protein NTX32_00650 [Candidatus Firestonebacteria bacterium]|nr:hypothetical protein [Candidatus Firestonebacteria bacterium]